MLTDNKGIYELNEPETSHKIPKFEQAAIEGMKHVQVMWMAICSDHEAQTNIYSAFGAALFLLFLILQWICRPRHQRKPKKYDRTEEDIMTFLLADQKL